MFDDVYILWLRQMRRYWRTRSRVLGAIGQPLLFLLALGYGLGSVYKRAGQGNYITFLVPGVITQTILFSAVFWGMIILFDKRFGFLKELLVAPRSRLRILLGSALGGATISMIQATFLLVVSFFFGFHAYNFGYFLLSLLIMMAMCLSLTALGAGIASMVEDFNGFQAINNFLIFPMFFLSSALYPLTHAPDLLRWIAAANPVTYYVDALRYTLIHQSHFSRGLDLGIIVISSVAFVYFALNRFNAIQV